jgi:acyl-coenzyme A thioesterase PaaI-like protein
MDAAEIPVAMFSAVPFARTLGLEFESAEAGRAVVRLPDAEAVHNHVGGPHAGALFALGESASGAVVLATFGDSLDRALPLAVRGDIAYRRVAMGPVRAMARLDRDPAEVVAELDAGGRPEFPVHVDIGTEDGVITAEMTVIWTLRPHRVPV